MVQKFNLPSHYNVPGHAAMGFLDAVIDRDSDVETPSMGTKRWNAMKYIIRAPRKGGAKDIKKAIDYLNRLLVDMERDERDGR